MDFTRNKIKTQKKRYHQKDVSLRLIVDVVNDLN